MATIRPGRRHTRGSALAYLTATMVALIAFASLAVDVGRVYVVRSELQLAADAAARYGATAIPQGVSTAEAYATTAAGDNKADGSAVVITSGDIEFGTWNASTRTFSVLTGSARSGANAMRVTARRTTANGGGVPLFFARVIGKTAINVSASSTAFVSPSTTASGIVGLRDITFNNNAFVAGYNSASNPNPTTSSASSSGNLSSNGAIDGGSGNQLRGNVLLGPSAPNVSGISVSGTTTRASSSLSGPPQATWNPQPNPNGIPQNYTASLNTTLPGGTYYFTSLTVVRTLTFSGPATLFVNGPVNLGGGGSGDDDDDGDDDDGDDDDGGGDDDDDGGGGSSGAALRAYNNIPANLVIKLIGNRTFGGSNSNGFDVVADIEGAGSDFLGKNNIKFRGRMVMRSIDVNNNAQIYYDTALGAAGAGAGSTVVTVR